MISMSRRYFFKQTAAADTALSSLFSLQSLYAQSDIIVVKYVKTGAPL